MHFVAKRPRDVAGVARAGPSPIHFRFNIEILGFFFLLSYFQRLNFVEQTRDVIYFCCCNQSIESVLLCVAFGLSLITQCFSCIWFRLGFFFFWGFEKGTLLISDWLDFVCTWNNDIRVILCPWRPVKDSAVANAALDSSSFKSPVIPSAFPVISPLELDWTATRRRPIRPMPIWMQLFHEFPPPHKSPRGEGTAGAVHQRQRGWPLPPSPRRTMQLIGRLFFIDAGLLPERRELPSVGLRRPLGFYAERNIHHPRRGNVH